MGVIETDVLQWAANYDGPKFHSLLCDPPYHLTSITKRFGKNGSAPAQYGKDGAYQRASTGFMGQQWDGGDVAFRPETWEALAEHLYPGAFGMAFASSRGQHRMACAIEDAGLILHPTIIYAFGSGFPKATRIDTQIDRAAGIDTEQGKGHPAFAPRNIGYRADEFLNNNHSDGAKHKATSDKAKIWASHRYGGQVLKPALEFLIVFQKPYSGRPIDNITETGAGALNVDKARVRTNAHDPERGALSCKFSVFPELQDAGGIPSLSLESCLDSFARILFALDSDNTFYKDLSHNGVFPGDIQKGEIHLYVQIILSRLFPNGVWCDLDLIKSVDSRSCCQSCRHLCDALLLDVQEAARCDALQLAYALERICKEQFLPLHNRCQLDSVHPSNLDDTCLPWSLLKILSEQICNTIILHSTPPSKYIPNDKNNVYGKNMGSGQWNKGTGRWPSNLILDDSEEVRVMFPETKSGTGVFKRASAKGYAPNTYGTESRPEGTESITYGDEGSAARFFHQTNWNYEAAEALAQADPIYYCAKPGRKERDAGLDSEPMQTRNRVNPGGLENEKRWAPVEARNIHPTVKPISLCKYLATLLLPPSEYAPRRILVPFSGSGSEMIGATLAGWDEIIGIEMSAEYAKIARARLAWWSDWVRDGQTDIETILGQVEEERALRESGQGRLF